MSTLTLVIGDKNLSSWSMRAWLALKRTGADFQEILIPLDQADTKSRILEHSPSGRVPLLRHGEVVVWDSLAICEHLAEAFPEARLWPADPAARATARAVSSEMHSGFQALRTHMPMNLRASLPAPLDAPGLVEDIERVTTLWEECRARAADAGRFLFGGFTVADAFFAPVVSRFRTYGVAPGGGAGAYMEAVWSEPVVREWADAALAEAWSRQDHE